MSNGTIRVVAPRDYSGSLIPQRLESLGTTVSKPGTSAEAVGNESATATGDLIVWNGHSNGLCRDTCITTDLPLFSARHHAPQILNRTQSTFTIYFEIHVLGISRGYPYNSSLAIGYCVQPYPTWRLPGWERGSLAVHGDDGRRYVNDDKGGKDFTLPFKSGMVVGLGMTFSSAIPPAPPGYTANPINTTIDFKASSLPHSPSPSSSSPFSFITRKIHRKEREKGKEKEIQKEMMDVQVFFTRDGVVTDRWNLHEQLDVSDGPVDDLDGTAADLYPAIGIFGAVDYEIILDRRAHLFQAQKLTLL